MLQPFLSAPGAMMKKPPPVCNMPSAEDRREVRTKSVWLGKARGGGRECQYLYDGLMQKKYAIQNSPGLEMNGGGAVPTEPLRHQSSEGTKWCSSGDGYDHVRNSVRQSAWEEKNVPTRMC